MRRQREDSNVWRNRLEEGNQMLTTQINELCRLNSRKRKRHFTNSGTAWSSLREAGSLGTQQESHLMPLICLVPRRQL